MSAFWQLYSGLDREGPGTKDDVLWALGQVGLAQNAMICDAGCGSGADTAVLAKALPQAQIIGVEKAAHLAAEAALRCKPLANVSIQNGDMGALSGSYDFIWCAGAMYFLGVTEGLARWRGALAPGGRIAFSEPCSLGDAPLGLVQDFWAGYPGLTEQSGIEARIAAAGYRVLGSRLIVGQAWLDYYRSLQERINLLLPQAGAALRAVLTEAQTEIDLWHRAPNDIAYALYVVEPE